MYVSIDCETTGLDCERHGLISVAFVYKPDPAKEYIAGQKEFRMNPGLYDIDQKSLEVNGYTEEEIRRWPDREKTIESIRKQIQHWGLAFDRVKPIGQNYSFDRGFLLQILPKHFYETYFDYHYLDTMCIGDYLNLTGKIKTKGTSLNSFREYYKIPTKGSHTAMKDALDTAEVLRRMINEVEIPVQ